MRVRQRAYFGIWSTTLSPPEITGALRIEPDEVMAKGGRRAGPPPMPKYHLWKVLSGLPMDGPIGPHLETLLPRIEPAKDRIRELLRRGNGTFARLEVVRYFEEGDEEFDEATYGLGEEELAKGWTRVSGQHPFLGFALEHDVIAFLNYIGAYMDFDEYG